MSSIDILYSNIKNNYNKKIKTEYKNYHVRMQILNLIKNMNKNNPKLEKMDESFFESFLFNRIKTTIKKPYSGYKYIRDEEYDAYKPLIYTNISYMDDIVNIINTKNNDDNVASGVPNVDACCVQKNKNYFIYKNFQFKRDDRINFLYTFCKKMLIKHNKKIQLAKKLIVLLLLRYMTIGMSGQQCSLSYDIYDYLYTNLNVKGEGFSSPLNSKLIEKNDTIICSIFNDIDKYFKSCGQFNKDIMLENNNFNWILNPPFLTSASKLAINSIIKTLYESDKKMIIILILPYTKVKLKTNLNNKYLYGYINKQYIHITSMYSNEKKKIKRQNNKQYFICNGLFSHKFGDIIMHFYTNHDHKEISLFEHMKKISDLWCKKNESNIQQSVFRFHSLSDTNIYPPLFKT